MQNFSTKEMNILRLMEVEKIIQSCGFDHTIKKSDNGIIHIKISIPFEYFNAETYSFSIMIDMEHDDVYVNVLLALFGEHGKAEHLADLFRSLKFSMDYMLMKFPKSFVEIRSAAPNPQLFEEEVVESIGHMLVCMTNHQYDVNCDIDFDQTRKEA